MDAREALARTDSFARGARLVRRLHASPVKDSYLVERRGERFVLRVDRPLAAMLGLDREAEFAVLQAAARAGLAPEPVCLAKAESGAEQASCGNGASSAGDRPQGAGLAILVTRYAPGRAWTAQDLRDARRLARLAALLRELHERRLPGPRLDFPAALTRYATLAASPAASSLARAAIALLPPQGRDTTILCHNDPIAGNIVGLRRPLLIDWEYAARGDPLFDIAVATHGLPAKAGAAFCAAYFGGAGRIPRERLEKARALYERVLALWLLAVQR